MPGRLPGSPALLGARAARARPTWSPPAGTPPPRPSGPRAGRCRSTVVPPGVDVDRFRRSTPRAAGRGPALASACRRTARRGRGLSRLVPRKGFDVLIEAAARSAPTRPDLVVAIGGARPRPRAARAPGRAAPGAPVRFLGRVPDDDLPALYGCADVFAMLCRNRWGGLEQEGFGIVFLEAAAAGVPQVAGAAGARPRRWSTARPGSSSAVRRDAERRGGGAGRAARRPRSPAPRWAPPAVAGRWPSSPTTVLADRLAEVLARWRARAPPSRRRSRRRPTRRRTRQRSLAPCR